MMLEPSNDRERALQGLSALSDGEADVRELRASVDAWRQDPSLRASWHSYALIGDVLRSEDLAAPVAGDIAFLSALRGKLAQEPVVFAPSSFTVETPVEAPIQAPMVVNGVAARLSRGRRPWATTAAVTASCMVVAGVALVWRGLPTDAGGAASPEFAQAAGGTQATPVSLLEVPLTMERNPELDRYLAAHRQFAQGPALAAPGGVRQVTLTPEGR